MEKILDLSKTVYELCSEYEEVKDIMKKIGFKEITNPLAMNSMGKIMTIPKGSKIKKIDLSYIIKEFEKNGFTVINSGLEDSKATKAVNTEQTENLSSREDLLKSYIERLNSGEDLKDVQADFVKNFKEVSYNEIVNAEQALIEDGMAVEKVQSLCDIHSALFHDSEICSSTSSSPLIYELGHPLNILFKENRLLEKLIKKTEEEIDNIDKTKINLDKLKGISSHYKKKDQVISPILASDYEITGPSEVMWGVDDEIKDEVNKISKMLTEKIDGDLKKRLQVVLGRMTEMIYKEENILFPLAEENLTFKQWNQVYHDFDDYSLFALDEKPAWPKAKKIDKSNYIKDDYVYLNSKKLSLSQLNAILETIPAEITFIDKNDILRYFSDKSPKIFPRPYSALGRDVVFCHPYQVKDMVKTMITEFKENKRDSFTRIIKIKDRIIRVKYLAVRDQYKNYLGSLELVEDLSEIADFLKEKK